MSYVSVYIFILCRLPAVNLNDTAAGIFVKRNVVSLYQLGILVLYEKRIVFCVVYRMATVIVILALFAPSWMHIHRCFVWCLENDVRFVVLDHFTV